MNGMARKTDGGVNEQSQEVLTKLDAIIRLLALQLTAQRGTVDAIRLLGRAGLDRNLIADVCQTTPNTVSVRLSEAKKNPKKSRPRVRRETGHGDREE